MAPVQSKLTGKERAKLFRQRHGEEARKKNRERMSAIRAKEKLQRQNDKDKYETNRSKETNRKRLYRQRKKTELRNNQPSIRELRNTYGSPQAFGKAISKSLKSLPNSPNKKRAVVSAIATNVGLNLQTTQKNIVSDDESHNLVLEFFFRPDIVFTAPGMKDEITVWKNGQKIKLRKYYLVTYLKEAYSIFKDENPNCSISFSTFCKLRPENVFLMRQTPEDQCKCMICENFFLKLKALKIPYDSKLFWKETLCDDSLNSKCWQGICEVCCKGQKLKCTEDVSNNVYWKKWEKNEDAKINCQVKQTCIGEVLDCMCDNFSAISSHINTKRIQFQEFQKDKNSPESRVLQLDFAMNYSCSYQDEVQSALWSRKSITLFTAAVFAQGKCDTYLICSDTSEKEKNTVRAFIEKIYEKIRPNARENNYSEEIIWTDGPSSEFKNRYMTLLLQDLSIKFKKTFHWKYFATAHGKGVVDGIGGKAKCLVRNAVMSKKSTAPIVQSADDFANVVKKAMPSTTVMLFLDKDINRNNSVWCNAKAISGISKMHGIKYSPSSGLEFFANAITPIKQNVDTIPTNTVVNVSIGNWVVVKYDECLYAGEVTQIKGNDIEVSAMEKSGKFWKWPKREDKVFYNISEVIKVIKPPIVINARGVFDFPDF